MMKQFLIILTVCLTSLFLSVGWAKKTVKDQVHLPDLAAFQEDEIEQTAYHPDLSSENTKMEKVSFKSQVLERDSIIGLDVQAQTDLRGVEKVNTL